MTQDTQERRYDLFFRNPHNYHQQLVELGEFNIAWDRGLLLKRRVEPMLWAQTALGPVNWKQYIIGDYHTQEYTPGCKPGHPSAVYPSWSFKKDQWDELYNYITQPWGSNPEYCTDKKVEIEHRPVFGQAHRIFLLDMPRPTTIDGRKVYSQMSDLQEANPQVEFYLHGSYSFSSLFGYAFTAGDFDARTPAAKDKLHLPNGSTSRDGDHEWCRKEIQALGYTMNDMSFPGERCSFNIISARHAAHNWKFGGRISRKLPQGFTPDVMSPTQTARFPQTNEDGVRWKPEEIQDTDKYACNSCSLWRKCSNFREGSVCTLTGSPGMNLSSHFNSKDPTKIVEGLRSILSKQAERVESQIENEDPLEGDKNIDKNLNALFRNGVTLAKLVDPSLRSGINIGIAVGGPSPALTVLTGNQQLDNKAIASSLIAEIEQKTGLPRDQITDDVIDQYIEDNTDPVDAEVVED